MVQKFYILILNFKIFFCMKIFAIYVKRKRVLCPYWEQEEQSDIYIALEVFNRMYGGISHKSYVYSYSMLILEIVGGRKNYKSDQLNFNEMYFSDWIYKDLEQGNIPSHIHSLVTDEENDLIKKTTLVSLWCIQTNPSNRPHQLIK
ncbi:hypothetical protein HN873_013296 [Arachis hypogaea]|uniref:Serine-threonine/tyrosine-protein kinase catalytic domain-containing protein n=1 Tax=Arachis hypogaea TaxID=3818 RepID=A0A445DEA7_ARAHY|nr:hypothetical protein Ahy_A04g018644 [Arachis hypogaea]